MTKAKKRKEKPQKAKPIITEEKKTKISFVKPGKWPLLILFGLSVLIYVQSFSYEYVLDDQIVITGNQYVKKGFSGIYDIFTTESFQGYFGEQKDLLPGSRYRPLSIATFAIEYQFFGNNSAIGHMVNMLLYGLTAMILYIVLLRMLPATQESKWFLNISFIAALFWAVHPVHTEVVANIKGRDEILALMGSLGALYYSLKYIDTSTWKNITLAGLCYFLGLLAKENTITFLAVIPVSLFFFRDKNIKKLASVFGLLVLLTALYLLIRYQVIGYLMGTGIQSDNLMNNPFLGMETDEKYATILYTLGQYLRLAFFPLTLTHDYYPFHIATQKMYHIGPLLSILAYFVIAGVGIYGFIKKNIVSYCAIFYLATLSIVSNLLFVIGTTMNERFIYISTIATCLFMAYVFKKMYDSNKTMVKNLALALVLLFSMFFLVRSVVRVPVWKSPLSLNAAAIKVSKNSARANCFMGTALFNEYRDAQDQNEKLRLLNEAEGYLNRSIELFPLYKDANQMKAGVVAEKFKYDRNYDEMLAGLSLVIQRRPDIEYLHQYCQYLNGRGDNESKLVNFYFEVGYNRLALVQNNYPWALTYLKYAEGLDPNDIRIRQSLFNIYSALGRTQEAERYRTN